MTDDAPALAQNKPLAIVALTCFINRFETLGFEGLGETLLRDGAAVAVIAPSSVGHHAHADELGTHFTARLKNGGAIGDILVDAERTYLAAGGDATLVTSENLLGDPTLPLAPEPGSAPSCASTPGALPFVAIVALLFVRRRWRRP